MSPIRIIGVGSPAGDDQVGWLAVEAVKQSAVLRRVPVGLVCLMSLDRPGATLVEHLAGAEMALLIDAMQSGAPAGTVRRTELPGSLSGEGALLSSHGFGVAHAVALAKVLGELPSRLVVYGVEAQHLKPTSIASEAARAAVTRVCEAIENDLWTFVEGE